MMPQTCAMAPDLDRHDWEAIARALDARGNAAARLAGPAQCAALAAGYASPDGYRSRIVMARHGFGRGEYKYFPTAAAAAASAAPGAVSAPGAHRQPLEPIARRSATVSRHARRVPGAMPCGRPEAAHAAHPAIWGGRLQRLHQDLYGERVFPLQVAILLSRPGRDFSGGEFVMTETASSGQRAEVIALDQGDALVFTVNHRPAPGKRGGTRRSPCAMA